MKLKFKIGDFVEAVIYGKKFMIENIEDNFYVSNGIFYSECDLKLWAPEHNEWCAFYNSKLNAPIIARFNKIFSKSYIVEVYEDDVIRRKHFDFAIPISELNTHLHLFS